MNTYFPTKKSLMIFMIALWLISFSSLISSLKGAQIEKKAKQVTLQLKWKHQFQFAGYYAAIEKGFYKNFGISVNLVEASGSQNPSEAVIQRKAEFGISTSDILVMRSQNKSVVVLASIFQHSAQILLASKQSGIENIHGLIGKKIALEPNAIDIITYMNNEGVSLDKCVIDEHSYNIDALLNNNIDAITAYSSDEPYLLQKTNFDYTMINPLMGGIDFYGDILFTTEKLIASDPKLVESFRKASLQGWKYAMDNPEEMIEIIYNKYSQRHSKEHLRFEAEHMKRLIIPDVVEIGYSNPGRWESILNIYKKRNMIDFSFTTKGLLYSDYVKSKSSIPWNIIGIFLFIITVVGSTAYYFYHISRKLKAEIQNRLSIQKELIESNELFQSILNASPDSITITDIDGRILLVSNATLKIMGYQQKEELLGHNFIEVIDPEDKDRATSNISNMFQGIPLGYEEYCLLLANGNTINSEIIAEFILDEKGQPKKIIFVTRDITERKLVEVALRESEEKFRTIIETSPDGIVITSLEGEVQYVSPHVLSMWGYELESEMIGKNMTEFFRSDYHEKAANSIAGMFNGCLVGAEEYVMIKKDGSEFFGEANANILYNQKNQPTNILLIERDITTRKSIELELLKQKQQLKESNDTKDKFFSVIAHDLKSPFQGFLSMTQIMAEEASSFSAEELTEFGTSLNKAANNVFSLLKNLLEWAQMQQDSMSFKPKELSLTNLIANNIGIISERSEQKGIEIINEATEPIDVYVDENMINSVFLNLLTNSVKFSNQGSKVTVKADRTENDILEISISDSGIGMNQNIVDKLFKVGEEVGRVGTDGEKSTGLGLLLCKEFVEKHGGKIWAESELGKGSKFIFILPLVK